MNGSLVDLYERAITGDVLSAAEAEALKDAEWLHSVVRFGEEIPRMFVKFSADIQAFVVTLGRMVEQLHQWLFPMNELQLRAMTGDLLSSSEAEALRRWYDRLSDMTAPRRNGKTELVTAATRRSLGVVDDFDDFDEWRATPRRERWAYLLADWWDDLLIRLRIRKGE